MSDKVLHAIWDASRPEYMCNTSEGGPEKPYAAANEQTRCARGRSDIVDGKKTVMSIRTVSNNRESIAVQSLIAYH